MRRYVAFKMGGHSASPQHSEWRRPWLNTRQREDWGGSASGSGSNSGSGSSGGAVDSKDGGDGQGRRGRWAGGGSGRLSAPLPASAASSRPPRGANSSSGTGAGGMGSIEPLSSRSVADRQRAAKLGGVASTPSAAAALPVARPGEEQDGSELEGQSRTVLTDRGRGE
jgi:hypothetical protein